MPKEAMPKEANYEIDTESAILHTIADFLCGKNINAIARLKHPLHLSDFYKDRPLLVNVVEVKHRHLSLDVTIRGTKAILEPKHAYVSRSVLDRAHFGIDIFYNPSRSGQRIFDMNDPNSLNKIARAIKRSIKSLKSA